MGSVSFKAAFSTYGYGHDLTIGKRTYRIFGDICPDQITSVKLEKRCGAMMDWCFDLDSNPPLRTAMQKYPQSKFHKSDDNSILVYAEYVHIISVEILTIQSENSTMVYVYHAPGLETPKIRAPVAPFGYNMRVDENMYINTYNYSAFVVTSVDFSRDFSADFNRKFRCYKGLILGFNNGTYWKFDVSIGRIPIDRSTLTNQPVTNSSTFDHDATTEMSLPQILSYIDDQYLNSRDAINELLRDPKHQHHIYNLLSKKYRTNPTNYGLMLFRGFRDGYYDIIDRLWDHLPEIKFNGSISRRLYGKRVTAIRPPGLVRLIEYGFLPQINQCTWIPDIIRWGDTPVLEIYLEFSDESYRHNVNYKLKEFTDQKYKSMIEKIQHRYNL